VGNGRVAKAQHCSYDGRAFKYYLTESFLRVSSGKLGLVYLFTPKTLTPAPLKTGQFPQALEILQRIFCTLPPMILQKT